MTDTEKPVEKSEDAPVARKKKDRQVGKKVVAGTNASARGSRRSSGSSRWCAPCSWPSAR